MTSPPPPLLPASYQYKFLGTEFLPSQVPSLLPPTLRSRPPIAPPSAPLSALGNLRVPLPDSWTSPLKNPDLRPKEEDFLDHPSIKHCGHSWLRPLPQEQLPQLVPDPAGLPDVPKDPWPVIVLPVQEYGCSKVIVST